MMWNNLADIPASELSAMLEHARAELERSRRRIDWQNYRNTDREYCWFNKWGERIHLLTKEIDRRFTVFETLANRSTKTLTN